MALKEYIEDVCGPYHDFWLLREEDHPKIDYLRFAGRKDAPVRSSSWVIEEYNSFLKGFAYIDTNRILRKDHVGLSLYGCSLITHLNASGFLAGCQEIMQFVEQEAESFLIPGGTVDIDQEDGSVQSETWSIRLYRTPILQQFAQLTQWSRQVEGGEYFILHLGV